MRQQPDDVVVIEVPKWFHRRRGSRESLRDRLQIELDKGQRKFVVEITDRSRFFSMDVGILLGVAVLVRDGGGVLAIVTENDRFHQLPHPSVDEGLIRFRNIDDGRRFVHQYIESRGGKASQGR
jgi:hypothetical protein